MCFRRNGKTRKCVAKRRDEESTEVGPTREAACISGPFDETPNVPLFAQQWRSNTGSCPFRHSRRYFTYLRHPREDTPAFFGRLSENITAREYYGFDKDIRELIDFFYRSLLKDDSTLVARETQHLLSISSINDTIIYGTLIYPDVHAHRVKHRLCRHQLHKNVKLQRNNVVVIVLIFMIKMFKWLTNMY